eukprot:EG_transcript_51544
MDDFSPDQSLRAGLGPVERSEAASQTPSTPAAEADTQTDEPPEEPSLPVTESAAVQADPIECNEVESQTAEPPSAEASAQTEETFETPPPSGVEKPTTQLDESQAEPPASRLPPEG